MEKNKIHYLIFVNQVGYRSCAPGGGGLARPAGCIAAGPPGGSLPTKPPSHPLAITAAEIPQAAIPDSSARKERGCAAIGRAIPGGETAASVLSLRQNIPVPTSQ
jgi:hypothetical protein